MSYNKVPIITETFNISSLYFDTHADVEKLLECVGWPELAVLPSLSIVKQLIDEPSRAVYYASKWRGIMLNCLQDEDDTNLHLAIRMVYTLNEIVEAQENKTNKS